MFRPTLLSFLAFGTILLAGAARTTEVAPVQRPASTFAVDIAHSTLNYRIRHFGVSWFYGRINMPTGSFALDADNPAASFVTIEAEIKNMDAGNKDRDRFLMGPDFFNAREFPKATFKSTSVKALDDGSFEATGEFTVHGVTQTLTVPITEYIEKDTSRFGYRAGFLCMFTFKRSEHGMTLFLDEGTLGDEVTVTAAIEGVRQ